MSGHLQRLTLNLPDAARLLGIGRNQAYTLAGNGEFPCPVLKVGTRYVVPRQGLAELLGVSVEALAEGGREVQPNTGTD